MQISSLYNTQLVQKTYYERGEAYGEGITKNHG